MSCTNRIAFVIPYYGSLPDTFPLWEKSAEMNSEIDFIILSDRSMHFVGTNIKEYIIPLEKIEKKASDVLGFNVKIDKPYKLCDYRPLYGMLFSEILEPYEFWGHCDIDLIFGRISHYVTDALLNSFDKLYLCGHFVLYRNSPEVNLWWKTWSTNDMIKSVFLNSKETYAFDEFGGMVKIIPKSQKIYNSLDFDDISFQPFTFRSDRPLSGGSIPLKKSTMIFEYDHGILYRHTFMNRKWFKDESMYVHFQKRKIKVNPTIDLNHFLLVPNEVVSWQNIECKEKYEKYKGFSMDWYLYRFNNLKRKIVKLMRKE